MLKTVYKPNIDIVHVQRDETSQLFSVSAQREAAAAGAAARVDDRAPGNAGTQPASLFQVCRPHAHSVKGCMHWSFWAGLQDTASLKAPLEQVQQMLGAHQAPAAVLAVQRGIMQAGDQARR
jgi:hypothetical protein